MMQYLDFSHASTSRKWTNKRQPGEGFDAPRNSVEFLAMEAPHSYGVFQEDVQYSCNNNNMRQYPKASAPIKKLIHEDLSFRPNEGHKRVPSVIARLMGMDSPPRSSATGEIITTQSDDKRQETTTRSMSRRERDSAQTVSSKHVSFVQHKSSARHAPKQEIRALDNEEEILGQLRKKSSSVGEEWSKQPPREHPQEEELQKFKKEFAAWQASKVWEQSRALELDYRHADEDDGGRCSEIVPYRYQQQEKQPRGGRDGDRRVHDDSNGDPRWRKRSKDSGPSISGSRTFSLTSAVEECSSTRLPLSRFYYEEEERPLSPARIVILKPCPELSADDVDESSMGSPELMKNENNMEAFLEEVKMRLKIELEGHVASDERAADRWADPKQIARNIADQIRETVTMDMHHPALVRSESTRSYRSSDVQSQMDYICRDARKQLSDRLRNVLRREAEADQPPPPYGSHRRRAAVAATTSPSWYEEEPRLKPTSPRRDVAARKSTKKIRSKEEKKRAIESSEVRSFRHGWYKNSAAAAVDSSDEAASPRNLMRSFSAPVSGTSNFVKLLSQGEPRNQRNHEGPPPSPEDKLPKGRKDTSGIKSRVSNLRQNLGLRGKLFGKKLHSAVAADESSSSFFLDDFPPIGTLVTAPSVLIHPGVLQENSTEVPPSPASWCSSPTDEMMIRGGYPSPVSPLEASFGEHRSPLKPVASSSACEQDTPWLEQDQVAELAETSPAIHDDDDDTAEMDDPMKVFIRAVLVVAGVFSIKLPLYKLNHKNIPLLPQITKTYHICPESQKHTTFVQNHVSERIDTKPDITDPPVRPESQTAAVSPLPRKLLQPIPKWVFDEVLSTSSPPATTASDDGDVDHQLLFDLINEALPGAVHGSTTLCAFSKWYAAPRRAPSGKRLLDVLWRSVLARLEPPNDEESSRTSSVDALIERDMSASPWTGVFRDDVDGLGEEMEAEILSELVDETLWDVLLNVGD